MRRVAHIAAILYAVVAAGVIVFQLALALGAPLGQYAMGGAVSGALPSSLRLAEVVQALVIAWTIVIVLAAAGVGLEAWRPSARWLIWVVVAMAAVSLVLNTITRSSGERVVWAPVAVIMLVASVIVAMSARGVRSS